MYKSDTLVSTDLKEALRKAAAPLEDVPASKQDWHPGSDDKVLDLGPKRYLKAFILLKDWVEKNLDIYKVGLHVLIVARTRLTPKLV